MLNERMGRKMEQPNGNCVEKRMVESERQAENGMEAVMRLLGRVREVEEKDLR